MWVNNTYKINNNYALKLIRYNLQGEGVAHMSTKDLTGKAAGYLARKRKKASVEIGVHKRLCLLLEIIRIRLLKKR